MVSPENYDFISYDDIISYKVPKENINIYSLKIVNV